MHYFRLQKFEFKQLIDVIQLWIYQNSHLIKKYWMV